jgi:hypothetical protein
MAYYKWALQECGGFDPIYRKAGDDVDVCWRIMQNGHQIGFSPAAVVWHYRRFEVKTYFSQQKGYGEAEAMLRYKHLNYFGNTGSAIWKGNVYSQVRFDEFLSKPVIYHGVFGTGFFQCVYPKRYSLWEGLLSSVEWLVATVFIFLVSIFVRELSLIPLIMFGLTLAVGVTYMMRAKIEAKFDSVFSRLLLLYLAITQPWSRGWARYSTWLRGKRTPPEVLLMQETTPHTSVPWWQAGRLSFWSESGREREHLLHAISQLLEDEGWKYYLDTGWTDWDIQIFASRWWNLRIVTMTEIYPAGRRLTRAGNYLNVSTYSVLIGGCVLTAFLLCVLAFPITFPFAAGISLIALAVWYVQGVRLRFRVAELIQVAGIQAGLQPVTKEGS